MSDLPSPAPESPGSAGINEPDEYNLYLGFLIPIGAILLLCIISLFVVSWQIICPECSNKHCPRILLSGSQHIANISTETPVSRTYNPLNRRTSITLLRRYSDTPPSYETVQLRPPSYDSVVIIEEQSRHGSNRRNTASSSIRTYVYDPTRRISIEVHDEDTIRVVEELLARKMSKGSSSCGSRRSRNNSCSSSSTCQQSRSSVLIKQEPEPPGYHQTLNSSGGGGGGGDPPQTETTKCSEAGGPAPSTSGTSVTTPS